MDTGPRSDQLPYVHFVTDLEQVLVQIAADDKRKWPVIVACSTADPRLSGRIVCDLSSPQGRRQAGINEGTPSNAHAAAHREVMVDLHDSAVHNHVVARIDLNRCPDISKAIMPSPRTDRSASRLQYQVLSAST